MIGFTLLINSCSEGEFKRIKHTERLPYDYLIGECFRKLYHPDLVSLNDGVVEGEFYASALKVTHRKTF